MTHRPHHQAPANDQDIEESFGDYRLYIGGHGSDAYSGTGRMDIAFGRNGSDYLSGRGQDDDLQGGKGSDVLLGGDGMNHLDGGKGNDVLIAGGAADALRGAEGNDYLDEGGGHGDLEGGPGNDVLTGGPGGDAFVVSPDSGDDVLTDFSAGPGMLDHLAVRGLDPEDLRFEDTFAGVKIGWDVAGGEGSVLLAGVRKTDLAQDDFMFTDDRMVIQPTSADADHVTAVSYAKDEGFNLGAPNPGGDTGSEDTFRFDEFNVREGSGQADTFQGTGDRDYYFGLGGNDRLSGRAGDDDLRGDAGNDVLDGGAGQDDLRGGAGSDRLYGGDQADNVMGEDGDDKLFAGAGHDMIEGGKGNDELNGGDGADAFIVGPDTGNDVVTGGFDAGPGAFDHIALRDILPGQVTVADGVSAHDDGHTGVLVSWTTAEGSGSIFLEGLTKSQMAQDDFMFNADDGREGGFVNDPAITSAGSQYIFQDPASSAAGDPNHSYVA
ncbi:calcium-binding protein [Methylobacterium variabile]|uniref:Calcium-binding protein n=1 Tax=Methylobacterium variabile TaxID=298794 RepID=A0A0J6SIC6_9HYPH|nr:calcium-binding protein [Methylobacterium variabile]KMO33093.1 calcium-binding protein [Methylobacterium variabile]